MDAARVRNVNGRLPLIAPVLGVVLAGLLLAACSGSSVASPSSGVASTTSTAASTPGSGSPTGTKQALLGLVDMGVQTSYALDQPFPTVDTSVITPYAGAFGGI